MPPTVSRHAQLDALLAPTSIAVVGASPREFSWGRTTIDNLDAIGFGGEVYPVNPRRSEILGRACYPSLDALPTRPDMAVIAVPAATVPGAIEDALAAGIPSAIVYASGFGAAGQGEGGQAGPDSPRARLDSVLADHRISVLGPNCLGLVNYHARIAPWGITVPLAHTGAESGVAMIAQSGNIALTVAGANRGFSLTHLISCGNQASVSVGELISACVRDPAVTVIAAIVEGVADPQALRTALTDAAEHDKPVVVLKLGRSSKGQAATMAHTGTLSGEPSLYRALFHQSGAIQVDDLDELIAVASLLVKHPQMQARGVAVMASSGGECGLISDLAEQADVPLPELPEATRDSVAQLLPDFARVSNPLDYTAGGWGDSELHRKLIIELARVEEIDTILAVHDAPTLEGNELVDGWSDIIDGLHSGAAAVSAGRVAVANVSSIGDLRSAISPALSEAGVVSLTGFRPAMSALAKIGRRSRALAEVTRPRDTGNKRDTAEAVAILDSCPPGRPLSESRAMDVLDALRIRTPRRRTASEVDAAVEAGRAIGYPVVAKVSSTAITHKSDVGGVVTGIDDDDIMARSVKRLLDIAATHDPDHGPEVLIEQMVPIDVELIVGARRDPQFGPVVMVGSGGVLTELLEDVTHRLAPFGAGGAAAMLEEITAGRLLAGYRGSQAANLDALVEILLAVSQLMTDTDSISDLDINPLAWSEAERAFIALDALVIRS